MMKKLLLLFTVFSVFTVNAQTFSNLVFESSVPVTATTLDLTFDYEGVVAGDTFEWQLTETVNNNGVDPQFGRNVAYAGSIVPENLGSGTQTVTFGVYNDPVIGEKFTWAGVIKKSGGADETMSYNNTGNTVTITTGLSTEDVNTNKIQVYPNPTSDKLYIHNSLQVNKIKIIDISGRTVLKFNNAENIKSIDVSSLTKGVYFLKTDLDSQLKFLKK